MKTIRRNIMLQELDIRTMPNGMKRIFSIKFLTSDGKVYFFPQAFAGGAGRMNMKLARVRGIQPCDCKGTPEGHRYPVGIDRILEYNKMKVVL